MTDYTDQLIISMISGLGESREQLGALQAQIQSLPGQLNAVVAAGRIDLSNHATNLEERLTWCVERAFGQALTALDDRLDAVMAQRNRVIYDALQRPMVDAAASVGRLTQQNKQQIRAAGRIQMAVIGVAALVGGAIGSLTTGWLMHALAL